MVFFEISKTIMTTSFSDGGAVLGFTDYRTEAIYFEHFILADTSSGMEKLFFSLCCSKSGFLIDRLTITATDNVYL